MTKRLLIFIPILLLAPTFTATAQSPVLEQVQVVLDELSNPRDIVTSPDGKHVYVAAGDSVGAYSRNSTTGALTGIDLERDGVNGVDGIRGVDSIAISPDGAHVYVGTFSDDSVGVFSRDAGTGLLTFVEANRNLVDGVEGLEGVVFIVVSPDGAHVYAVGTFADAVVVFSRNIGTGALTFVEFLSDGVNGVDGLSGVSSVTVAPGGTHVYVAAGAPDNTVALFGRNAVTGVLTFVTVLRDGVNGVEGLSGATSVAVAPGGAHVYVSSSGDDALAVFSRENVTGALTFVEAVSDDANGVDGLDNASSVSISADGTHVYVASRRDDALAVFSRNGASGVLTFVEVVRDEVNGIDGLDEAVAVNVSPDGAHVYAAGNDDGAVVVLSRSVGTGALSFVEDIRDGVNGLDGFANAEAVSVSPDGAHVYVAGTGDNALAVFSRDGGTGFLTFVEVVRDGVDGVDGLEGVSFMAISPDGAHAYATGAGEDTLAVFSRDGGTGALSFVEVLRDGVNGVDGLNRASSVVVSPDGAHVYVTAATDDALVLFSRNAGTGVLTFVEVLLDGVSGVDGLNGAASVAVSPGGAHVYVAGESDDALAVFSRDVGTGVLTFVEIVLDGVGGVDGLNGASFVAISPDGAHVYATGDSDSALAVFSRDVSTGALTFVEAIFDGVNGVDGLDEARSVVASADGEFVYAVGKGEDALAVFSRDMSTGALTFVEVLRDGVNGIDGIEGATSVRVSPDGGHVYAVGEFDDAVAVYRQQVFAFMEGSVFADNGVIGLSCATLELATPDRSFVTTAVTDLNGYYSFSDVPEGTYDVRVISPGFNGVVVEDVVIDNAAVVMQDFTLSLSNEAPDISGVVSDLDNGSLLVGVLVEASVNDVVVDTTYTCASGAYEIFVPGGKGPMSVELEFSLANYFVGTQTVGIVPGNLTEADQSLEKSVVASGSIRGFVFDMSDGKGQAPIIDARVTVRGGSGNASVRTDGNGAFSFDGLLDGRYTVRASSAGFEGETAQRILADGDSLMALLALGEEGPRSTVPADVNADGAVNSVDIQLTINAVLGVGSPGNDADVNNDNKVNSIDIQLVINAVLGIKYGIRAPE